MSTRKKGHQFVVLLTHQVDHGLYLGRPNRACLVLLGNDKLVGLLLAHNVFGTKGSFAGGTQIVFHLVETWSTKDVGARVDN